MRRLLPLLLLMGCGDDGLYVLKSPPKVSIVTPVDGSEFETDSAIQFLGIVKDDSPPEDLLVEWISSINGPIPDTDPPDSEGNVEVTTASLEEGTHVVTLRATDPANDQEEDQVTIEVMKAPDLPSIQILHPAKGERGVQDMPFVFMASVSDHQDYPEELSASLSSDLGGFICYLEIDGEGNSQCSATLPIATYMLTFEVTDTDGFSATAQATFSVLSPDDADLDGDGTSVNGGDCNDSNDTIYPGAPELCDGLDNDCNKVTGIDIGSECYDDDGDGYCEVPPCMNASNTQSDCDDTSTSISPAATEVLNGVDDDCDGFIDEGTAAYDDDGDGYCESPPCVNASGTRSDCDDSNYEVYPTATEVCDDGLDNDCDGLTNERDAIGCHDFYLDADRDTYGIPGTTQCWCEDGSFPFTGITSTDCYDNNANAYPGQPAYFTSNRGDGSWDYNCTGSAERQYTDVSAGCSWDIVYIECVSGGEGWDGTTPSCGGSGRWIDDCSATYDPVCYALCLLSSDPIRCLMTSCGATCDEEYASLTQGCH